MRSVAETSVGRTVQGAILAGEAQATARVSGSPTALAQASYALGLALEGTDPDESLRLLRDAAGRARVRRQPLGRGLRGDGGVVARGPRAATCAPR